MRGDVEDGLSSSLTGGRAPGDLVPRDVRTEAERVVAPAMAEAGWRMLEPTAGSSRSSGSPERTTCRGVTVPTSARMNVFRRHRTVDFEDGAPHVHVVCDRAGRRVPFRRTPLLSGTGPEDVETCGPDALTRDLVRDRIAAMLDILTKM